MMEERTDKIGEDLAAYKQELVKELFRHSVEGTLDRFIRTAARKLTRLAVSKGEVAGNRIHARSVFEVTAYLRDLAARALPDGNLLGIPRADIERMYGPQKWT